MAIRKIIKLNDERLREKSKEVAAVDQQVRRIFADMADTMYSIQRYGGLAACQIGILNRLIIADMGQGLLQLANPHIIEAAGEQVSFEGCLSFPGTWGKVIRPQRIVVKALNPKGRPVTVTAFGALARCLSHEIDHLDGIVFTDKIVEYIDIKNPWNPAGKPRIPS